MDRGHIMLRNIRVALFLSLESLRKGNKATIALTVIIVSLAFINLVFISSILGGLVDALNRQMINNMVSNIIVEPQEQPTRKDFIVHPEIIQHAIENIPGVIATAQHYKLPGTIAYDKNKKGDFKSVAVEITGVDPAQEQRVTNICQKMVDGHYLESPGKGEIILGIDLAGGPGASNEFNSLGGVKVGDEVRAIFSNGVTREYEVKGIYRAQFGTADRMAFITVDEAETVLSVQHRASQILVKTDETRNEDFYIPQIQSLASNLQVRKWTYFYGAIGGVSGSVDIVSSIVSMVGLAVAAITMFILIYVNVVNKRRQIGILKAIGIKQDIIIYSYVFQALLYSIAGVVVGTVSIFYFIAPYFLTHPLNLPIGNTSLALDHLRVAYNAASFLIMGVLAGLIPSWRVARENILKAIWGA
jgi:putative ABC transport system permease protein